MGKPTIKEIQATGFLDGSIVFENDAQIHGQLEGNVELEDLSETRSTYNIDVGPLYYGPDPKFYSGAFHHPGDDTWKSPDVSILVWKAPRAFRVRRLQVNIPSTDETEALTSDNVLGLPVATQFLNPNNNITATIESKPSVDADGAAVALTGAFQTVTGAGWSPLITLTTNASGYTEASPAFDTELATTIKKGEYVRIMLRNLDTDPGGGVEYGRAQAIITVTLTVTEEHVE